MNLATIDAQDPSQWNLKVFLERFNPIEDWLNVDFESADPNDFVPRVNIIFEKSIVDRGASDVVKIQKFTGIFNIDVYAMGVARNEDSGHTPGDMDSALQAQRALRLVRNILMASTNA